MSAAASEKWQRHQRKTGHYELSKHNGDPKLPQNIDSLCLDAVSAKSELKQNIVPESAAADGFKPVIVSEADTSFILHTQSSMIPDHSGEESFHVSTESDADDVKISFSSRASTSVAPGSSCVWQPLFGSVGYCNE
ncbi:hypothetical protein BaRGS_00029168 [Batillaria attramentaria]|uniref:Uncharacterized protein n=1 Tax=Batillaria attramentaria TaxID=370345 RepID=A0ABD0JXY6_9CAEN